MRVLILTEGSSHVGFGHVTRCISLYHAFEEKGATTEFVVNGDESVSDFLKGANCHVFNWLEEHEKLYQLLNGADIAIIDSYIAGYDFYRQVSDLVKIPLYIDDNRRLDYPHGIVVNGTIFAEEINYPEKQGMTYLLGSRYIPLRKEFWTAPERPARTQIESIMISFGGDDTRNMSTKVLQFLRENYPACTKYVVIGKGFCNISGIEAVKDKATHLMYFPDAKRMKDIMLESDIAISAAGQTLYELARIGVPTVAIAVAENQLRNVTGWQKSGFLEYAGWYEDKALFVRMKEGVDRLRDVHVREHKISIGREMVDGRGAHRVAKACRSEYVKEYLAVRNAEVRDMHHIYELSNDPYVRDNSFNQDQIKFDEHRDWFMKKVISNRCAFMVAEVDSAFAGQIRFDDNDAGDEATVSISIEEKYRGLGLSEFVLRRAIEVLKRKKPNIVRIKAYVKEENVPSRRSFEKSNFRFIRETAIQGQKALEYLHDISRNHYGI